MARAPRYSARDNIMAVLQGRTQREAAAFLGVSERTIRRWKNEGVQPSRQHAPVLSQGAARARKTARDSARRLRTPTVVPAVPVPPTVTRRVIWDRDRKGKPLKTKRESAWVNYNVGRMDSEDIITLIEWLRDTANPNRPRLIQITYHVPKGGTSLGGREYKEGGFANTAMIDVNGLSREEIQSELDYVISHAAKGHARRIVTVHALDQSVYKK